MSLSAAYHLDCDQEDLGYTSEQCVDLEFGKVRSVAFIRKKYLGIILASPGDLNSWITGINAGLVIILPFVSGSFDPGEPARLKGYGRRPATRGKREMVLSFNDPSYLGNYEFYRRIQQFQDLVPAYRTGKILHIGSSAADIIPSNPVEEDIESNVVWQVQCRTRDFLLPAAVEVEALAELFILTGQVSSTLVFASGESTTIPGLRRVARFTVGAVGSPMDYLSTTYTNPALAGKRALVLANGIGLPVDYGDGEIDFSGANAFTRRLEKTIAGDTLTFIGGVQSTEIIEIYRYEN